MSTSSLLCSNVVPRALGVLVPVLLVCCIAVFAQANSSVGTSIQATMRINKYRTARVNIFEFSLWESVNNMWDAKTYYLAVLIAVWSGAWVYVKTVLLILAWILPPASANMRCLSMDARKRVLVVLLVLAKWALCDVFLLVFFDVAFRFHVNVSGAPVLERVLPEGFISADLVVKPEIGCFTFISATVVVIICINLADFFHHNQVQSIADGKGEEEDGFVVDKPATGFFKFVWCPKRSWFEQNGNGEEEVTRSICTHQFTSSSTSTGILGRRMVDVKTGRISWSLKCTLLACLILMFPVVSYAAMIESFSFRFKALAGLALEFIEPGSEVRHYSFLKLIRDLSASSVVLDDEEMELGLWFGVAFMQTVTVLFALILPFFLIVLCLLLLLLPLRVRDQKILLFIAKFTSSLSSLDVFAVSVIIAVSQLEQFSLFIQKDVAICGALKDYAGLDCFRVQTELLTGCWLLFFSAFALFFVSQTVFALCERVANERSSSNGNGGAGDHLLVL